MAKKKITIMFDMKKRTDERVYNALQNLIKKSEKTKPSKVIINFINDLAVSVAELEEALEKCEHKNALCTRVLGSYLGRHLESFDFFINENSLSSGRTH